MSDYSKLFNKCIAIILKNEGGYVNHPNDPGGETKYGIARKFYPYIDIKNLTRKQATAIYYKDYWLPMRLTGIINEELVLHIFDMGVNAGKKTSIKILQRLVGTDADGIIGPITLSAINTFTGDILDEFIKRRKLFYVTLIQNKPELRVFIKGWLKRVDNTHF